MAGIVSYHNDWVAGPQAMPGGLEGSPEKTYAETTSPWFTKGSQLGHLTVKQMLNFARFLWKHDPTFQQGVKRVIGYFLTDLEFYDPTHKAELKEEDIVSYRQILEGKLNIKYALSQILQNYCIYGNVIVSLLPPFERRLACPNCRIIHPLSLVVSEENSEFRFKYHAKGPRFEATCQRCDTRSDWYVYDTPGDYRRNISLTIYNPYHFTIECDQFSDKRLYTWHIPSDLKASIKEGNPLRLANTPLNVLKAVGEDKDFLFNDNILLHLREPEIIGFDTGGWGIPQAMFCYGVSRYVFGLRKMNEVLASDYFIPMRVLSPAQPPKDGGGFNESWVVDMADWNTQTRSMIANHRRDPAAIHTAGFPLQYQVLGAEGKDLVPGELLLNGENMQLNAMGIPAQLHRGDLSIQTAPMMARLFESHWQHIPASANSLLKWTVEKITPNLGWKEFGVRLTPPKIADNMEHLMLLLQMMQAGEVTATTILGKLGHDRSEEQRRKKDEAIQSAKMESSTQAELSKIVAGNESLNQSVEAMRAMMAGGGEMPPQGGSAPAGAPVGPPAADPLAQIMAKIESFGSEETPISPLDLLQVAQEAAALLAPLTIMEKRQKLREIEQKNKVVADLIRQQIEDVTDDQDRQFVVQGREIAQQQGGAPPPM